MYHTSGPSCGETTRLTTEPPGEDLFRSRSEFSNKKYEKFCYEDEANHVSSRAARALFLDEVLLQGAAVRDVGATADISDQSSAGRAT